MQTSAANIEHLKAGTFGGLALKLVVLAVMAAALYLLGCLVELPPSPSQGLMAQYGRPGNWPRFTWLLAPLGLALMSTACELLARWLRAPNNGLAQAEKVAQKAGRSDWLAFLAWPLWSLCLLGHRDFDWALTYGAVFVAALSWQAFVMGRLLWQVSALDEPGAEKAVCWGNALLCFTLFAALALWTIQAVSTAGDETRYLIDADRILYRLGLSQSPALEARPRQEFYWGRWSRFLGLPLRQNSWITFVLTPGIGLAGRPGALWVLSAGAAACLWFFYACARNLGYRRRPVLIATWALGACAPFAQLTQHIYPGVLGMLGVSLGLWLLLKPGGRAWLRLGGVGAVAVLMPLIKLRLFFTALGLALAGLGESLRRVGLVRLACWLGLGLALAAGAVVALLILQATVWPRLGVWRKLAYYPWNMYPDWGRIAVSLPAMFLDQEYGLLFYAPWLGLAFIGVWSLARQHPRALAYTLLLAGFTVAPLVLFRWQQWDGGFTPPSRFLAPLLPLLSLWVLPVFNRPARALVTAAISGLLASGAAINLALLLMPQWRYHRGAGVNNLFCQMGSWLDLELGRFFPSFLAFRGPEMAVSLAWLAALLIVGLIWWRGGRRPQPHKQAVGGKAVLMGVVGALGLLTAMALAGRLMPTASLEAEGLFHKGGVLYGAYYTQLRLYLLNQPGDALYGRLTWGAHSRTLIIEAFHVEVDNKSGQRHTPPVVLVSLGQAPPVRLVVDSTKPKLYCLDMKLTPGRKNLRIQYLRHQGRDQVALDRIMVR